jgi:hypothetical protein
MMKNLFFTVPEDVKSTVRVSEYGKGVLAMS